VPATVHGSSYVPTEEWTWRLLDRGFTLDEAAAIRGLDRSAVVRHATLAARQGKPIDVAALLDPETLRRWDEARAHPGAEGPHPGIGPADLWPLFLAARRAT
jgi:ATP-dependent DNA helicase RecQ